MTPSEKYGYLQGYLRKQAAPRPRLKDISTVGAGDEEAAAFSRNWDREEAELQRSNAAEDAAAAQQAEAARNAAWRKQRREEILPNSGMTEDQVELQIDQEQYRNRKAEEARVAQQAPVETNSDIRTVQQAADWDRDERAMKAEQFSADRRAKRLKELQTGVDDGTFTQQQVDNYMKEQDQALDAKKQQAVANAEYQRGLSKTPEVSMKTKGMNVSEQDDKQRQAAAAKADAIKPKVEQSVGLMKGFEKLSPADQEMMRRDLAARAEQREKQTALINKAPALVNKADKPAVKQTVKMPATGNEVAGMEKNPYGYSKAAPAQVPVKTQVAQVPAKAAPVAVPAAQPQVAQAVPKKTLTGGRQNVYGSGGKGLREGMGKL